MALLNIKNLSFTYKGSTNAALSGVNFAVDKGEFIVVCGQSGCGKSTLLRLLKPNIASFGNSNGTITFNNVNIADLPPQTTAFDIGYVMQNPENQIVTDKVWHELAFGLESMGQSQQSMRCRVAEICGYFGITSWYNKNTHELSGGQKQLLNLASIMATNPKLLILDEPTAQLDPIAASEFIFTLSKLNAELGLTIILVEHRLEEVFPLADKVAVMDNGGVAFFGIPEQACRQIYNNQNLLQLQLALPSAVRIFNQLNGQGACPISVRQGKSFFNLITAELFDATTNLVAKPDTKVADQSLDATSDKTTLADKLPPAVELSDVYFRYSRSQPDVLNGLSLNINQNEIMCILGANGAGKTTLLNVISAASKPHSGTIKIYDKKIKQYSGVSLYRNNLALLPQNPQFIFVKDKVLDDLLEAAKLIAQNKQQAQADVAQVAQLLSVSHLLQKHPYDISGGELQKVALAKLLLLRPRLILLDEPTKGLDAFSKHILAQILFDLKRQGKTIIIVTHDIEFAAEVSDKCAMFFDGNIVSCESPQQFFSANSYYTTAASRISRDAFCNTVTVSQVVQQFNLVKREKQ